MAITLTVAVTEQADLRLDNEQTVTLETEAVTYVPAGEIYDGEYIVTPKAHNAQVLATEGKVMNDNVTVLKVPYYETSNVYDGKTIFIAEDLNNG